MIKLILMLSGMIKPQMRIQFQLMFVASKKLSIQYNQQSFHYRKMKSMVHPTFKASCPSGQIFTRPKTAIYSYKKLTQILQGKYISIQNKIPSKQLPKSGDDKKRQQVVIQAPSRLQSAKRMVRNPSIDNCKSPKQNGQLFNVIDFEQLKKRRSENKTSAKQIQSEKENTFVPYAQQEQYSTVSQPAIPPQKSNSSRIKKRTQDQKSKLDKTSDQIEVIQSWKNEQQAINFSSLFKKSWRF